MEICPCRELSDAAASRNEQVNGSPVQASSHPLVINLIFHFIQSEVEASSFFWSGDIFFQCRGTPRPLRLSFYLFIFFLKPQKIDLLNFFFFLLFYNYYFIFFIFLSL